MHSLKPLLNMSLPIPILQQTQKLVGSEENEFDEQGVPNGIDTVEWHAMSDERRAQFMRNKRKQEAFKTEMCKGFIRTGYCRYGVTCRFAHFQEELRVRAVHPKYKTELCLNFSTRGECGYGSRCQFIHRSPDQCNRLRTTSENGTSSETFAKSCAPTSFYDTINLNNGAKSSVLANRFAMSAFQSRDHTNSNNYVETFFKLIQDARRNENDVLSNNNKEKLIKDDNDKSDSFTSMNFNQWNPFSTSFHPLFNKNSDETKLSNRSDYISSSNSAASNNGSGLSGCNSSCYDNGHSPDCLDVQNSLLISSREKNSLLNPSSSANYFSNDFSNSSSENKNVLSNNIKFETLENNSVSSLLYDQWNPYTDNQLINDMAESTASPLFLQSLINSNNSSNVNHISATKNVPIFSADFSSTYSPYFDVSSVQTHQTFLSS